MMKDMGDGDNGLKHEVGCCAATGERRKGLERDPWLRAADNGQRQVSRCWQMALTLITKCGLANAT